MLQPAARRKPPGEQRDQLWARRGSPRHTLFGAAGQRPTRLRWKSDIGSYEPMGGTPQRVRGGPASRHDTREPQDAAEAGRLSNLVRSSVSSWNRDGGYLGLEQHGFRIRESEKIIHQHQMTCQAMTHGMRLRSAELP